MILLPHIALWLISVYCYFETHFGTGLHPAGIIVLSSLLLLYAAVCTLLHVLPYGFREKLSLRIKAMYSGRILLRYCFWGIVLQLPFYLVMDLFKWPTLPKTGDSTELVLILADLLVCILHFYFYILNGCIRILCTCRSLGIFRRLFIIFTLWVPMVNLFLLRYLCRKAKEEYDAEACRFETRTQRDGSMLCGTKYPLILLHGIGFRDMKTFNYWGRIPKELTRNGAIVYYGHQQAFGTIEDNARIIRETILDVLEENHCEKVNIIAHSKGGLDARYLISGLHMEDKVASLTTISTPHRGSELMNVLIHLPDGIYRLIASLLDSSFHLFGDDAPDCYHSSRQLTPFFCETFNETYKDAPGVYYQSYASVVTHTFGDGLLWIPNLLMFFAGAPKNDGLVSIDSAKWGDFRQVFTSTGHRGISHGDMIDLKREDYKGFDVIEAYVGIVARLKELGY